MTSTYGKFRSLLATARIANVPSVVSNVWVGIAIGAGFQGWIHQGSLLFDIVALMLAGVCLYVSGNFLNDWHDREWDRTNRPERALPAGLFSPTIYLIFSLAFAIGGLVLAASVHLGCVGVALLILILILIYTIWHKRAVWTVIPMGLCRALLPVMGLAGVLRSSVGDDWYKIDPSYYYSWYKIAPSLVVGTPLELAIIKFHALALLIYIAALSLGARYESSAQPSKMVLAFSKGMLVFSGLLAASLWLTLSLKATLIGMTPFAIWMGFCLTKYRRPIPVHVSALLAGIPLIDWIALLTYVRVDPPSHYPPALQPYIFACFFIPPLAFIAGRLLQRLAPAT